MVRLDRCRAASLPSRDAARYRFGHVGEDGQRDRLVVVVVVVEHAVFVGVERGGEEERFAAAGINHPGVVEREAVGLAALVVDAALDGGGGAARARAEELDVGIRMLSAVAA